jgi:microcystin-dependent protein
LITAKAKYADSAATATNALTLNGLDASKYFQPQNTTASTFSGPVTHAAAVTITQTLAVAGATTFSDKVTVNGEFGATSTINGGFVPVGGIIMWSGSSAPSGWALCDGTGTYTFNGSSTAIPDLRDRFIVGSGHNYNLKATGGATSTTLGASNIPDHRHSFKDTVFAEASIGSSSNSGPDGLGSGTDGGNNYPGSKSGNDYDNNLSWIKRYSDYARGNTSSVDPVSTVPPYYALAYIIRVK